MPACASVEEPRLPNNVVPQGTPVTLHATRLGNTAALRSWCKYCLPGRLKPDLLSPGVVGMRGPTIVRLRPCNTMRIITLYIRTAQQRNNCTVLYDAFSSGCLGRPTPCHLVSNTHRRIETRLCTQLKIRLRTSPSSLRCRRRSKSRSNISGCTNPEALSACLLRFHITLIVVGDGVKASVGRTYVR